MTALERIVGYKRWEIAARKRLLSEKELRDRLGVVPRPLDFAAALRRGKGPRVVAEFKRASPSRGAIYANADTASICCDYADYGAVAISVLTDGPWFWGSLLDLWRAREQVGVPLLRKEFVVDSYQVVEARAHGADAVLLIVAALEDSHLFALSALTRELGMTPLLEAHDERDLDRALATGSAVIGINNRDLKTMKVDLATAERLRGRIPAERVAIAESGIKTHEDLKRMADAGYDACLVGETLMSSERPGSALKALLSP